MEAQDDRQYVESDDRQYVDYECHDHIATIVLNRPEKLNAVSDEVVRQLMAAFRRFDADPDARVAILCGRGRAFCSGADVHQRQLRSREEFERLGGPQGHGANAGDLLFQAVNWKPVIAAVHGYVLGLGLGMVLDCDLVVAETVAHRLVHRRRDAVFTQQGARIFDDHRVLGRHAVQRRVVPDRGDRRFRNVLPPRASGLRAPDVLGLELARHDHRGQHADAEIERPFEPHQRAQMRDAAGDLRTVEEHAERAVQGFGRPGF